MPMKNLEAPLIFPLVPGVQHYDWGGTSFIPKLLGRENPDGRPFAELWMGAHPANPSLVHVPGGSSLGLDEWIAQHPEPYLGHETLRDFGELPFLLKVLDVAKPLSIQVHPNRERARAGFDEEDGRDVPRAAVQRKFKDPFHKPELVMALEGAFWALAGFRPVPEIKRLLSEHPELSVLSTELEASPDGLKHFYGRFMAAPQEDVDQLLRPLLGRLQKENARTPFPKEDPRYWVLRANDLYSSDRGIDLGLLSIFLMNLLRLTPGEAIYIHPGQVHAFLEGVGLEISANSDNVIRGGLTHKFVDVPELLKTIEFGEKPIRASTGIEVSAGEWAYPTPAKEFELGRLTVRKGESRVEPPSWGARIYFVAPGAAGVDVETDQGPSAWRSGESFFVPRGVGFRLTSSSDAVVFRAGLPPVDTFRGRRPAALGFGTSGLRGRIDDITDLEAYVNTRGFLRYAKDSGGGARGWTVSVGLDLRPSSPRIAAAAARAARDEGARVENHGRLPSPALMSYACPKNQPSVMVTGSHIPFDRNGIKFNLAGGEVLKSDEPKILAHVRAVRAEEYNRSSGESLFDDRGFFKAGDFRLPPESAAAREAYVRRYVDFFSSEVWRGMRIVVYQHSAVGRDLLVEILRVLGADAIPLGRSEDFVPIDTEDISDERLDDLQRMANDARAGGAPIDALVSTDGDSDRPLMCGPRPDGSLSFFPGDGVGPLVAEFLGADGVAAPVSVNDAVDDFLKGKVLPRTRIGSPFVIDAMRSAPASLLNVVGYEANGGFLVRNEIKRGGRRLSPLPTRDAVLPILSVLLSARERGLSLVQLFDRLPRRFTKAGLLDNFPVETAQAVLRSFFPPDHGITEVNFLGGGPLSALDATGRPIPVDDGTARSLAATRQRVEAVFNENTGFRGGLVRINFLDGLRLRFGNGDVAHIRPSGNAPQLRLYACADTPERAHAIVRLGLREPGGLVRSLLGLSNALPAEVRS